MANRVKRLLRSALIRLLPDAGVRLGAHAARWYVRRAPINAGKQFDMMVYPNEHHGIESHRQHVYTKIRDYFFDKL